MSALHADNMDVRGRGQRELPSHLLLLLVEWLTGWRAAAELARCGCSNCIAWAL